MSRNVYTFLVHNRSVTPVVSVFDLYSGLQYSPDILTVIKVYTHKRHNTCRIENECNN